MNVPAPSFASYVLLCLILVAPFAPLVARIIVDYLNDRAQTQWTEKVT